jgi:hypothetical protein
VNKARQRSIGTKTGAALMPLVAGVAQSKLFFLFLIGVNYENHSHCVNDKNPSGYRLRFPYVDVKNAVQILQFTDRSLQNGLQNGPIARINLRFVLCGSRLLQNV